MMRSPHCIVLRSMLLLSVPSVVFTQTITQEQFLERLMNLHPLIQKERMTAESEREAQNGLLGAEDWFIRSQIGFSHEEPALSFAGPERTNALALNAEAGKVLWSTGGRLSASFQSSTASILPRFGFSMPLYQNIFAVSYVHPLLKNRGGSLDRLGYDLKRYDIDVAELTAAENIEAFLSQSATLFLTWVFLTEQEKIVAERLRLSQEERDRTAEKRRANLVDQADVMRAEDAVRAWKQQQVLVQSQWKALQAQLAVLAQDTDLYTLRPDFDLYAIGELPPVEEATARLQTRSRILRAIDGRKRQLEAGREGYEDALQPDLSAYARVNTKRLDEGLGKSFVMDKPDASIGLQFSIPLGNTTTRSEIARSDIQIAQLEKQRAEVDISLTSVLTNLHIRLSELKDILALNQDQIISAGERTKEELNLYNQGRGDLTFVILSRDNEQNARMTYAQNAWTYHTLRLEYSALMDELYRPREN